MTDIRSALEALVKQCNEYGVRAHRSGIAKALDTAEAALASYIPQPPEPGEAAKGGTPCYSDLRSERDALQRRVEMAQEQQRLSEQLSDVAEQSAKQAWNKVRALEAALAQAEGERAELTAAFEFVRQYHSIREPVDVYYCKSPERFLKLPAAMRASAHLHPGLPVDPSPTRSVRAEARSDGEGELLHDRIPVQEGPARAAKSHRAQPPQPAEPNLYFTAEPCPACKKKWVFAGPCSPWCPGTKRPTKAQR